jgi:hypothetical protein
VSAYQGNEDVERAQRLADDYARTVEVFALLADIRFKLLAFVPSIVGATIALASRQEDQRVFVSVALLGFGATLGILLYELRYSELYNDAAHRASVVERELGLILAVPQRERQSIKRGAVRRELWPRQGGVFPSLPSAHGQARPCAGTRRWRGNGWLDLLAR